MMMRISSAQSHLIESKPLAIPFDEKLTRPYRRVERLSQGYTEGNFRDMTS
jgi:hypothetical protein